MRCWLVVLAACGSTAPPLPSSSPQHQPQPATPVAAAAVPARLHISPDLGPAIDQLAPHLDPPQNHELSLTTATTRITLRDADPSHAEVAPLADPARRTQSLDGTWAVETDYARSKIVAGSLAGGVLEKAVAIHGEGPLVRFVAGLAGQRTVLLDRGNLGWYIVRSADGGSTWKEKRIFVAGYPVASGPSSFDVVTQDGSWIRVDRNGDVTTMPLKRKVTPGWYACAATVLWVPEDDHLVWFDETSSGSLKVSARGQLICAGEDVIVPVEGGLTRCTRLACGPTQAGAAYTDHSSEGIATATQQGTVVHLERTGGPARDLQLAAGERLVGLAVWNDIVTLVVLGANGRLHLAHIEGA